MTHDELLAICDNYLFKNSAEPVKALRAVVELHKPIEDKWIDSGFRCAGCDNRCGCGEGDMNGDNDWATCPTIQAIEKVLDKNNELSQAIKTVKDQDQELLERLDDDENSWTRKERLGFNEQNHYFNF